MIPHSLQVYGAGYMSNRQKKVIVFGATSAIARAVLNYFAKDGYACCLIARDENKLTATAEDLLVRGAASIVTINEDLSDYSRHPLLFEKIQNEFGDYERVLIAYGTLSTQKDCESSFDETLKELTINCLSVISLLTHIGNTLEQQQSGQVAVISSVAGDRGRQSNYVYGTAKGALSVFLQGLRNRLSKSNVNVITIKPGFVDTPMTREFDKKGLLWVKPEKVAKGIYHAMMKKRDVVYLPWFWQWIMLIIKLIPERIFKKLSL